MEKTPRWVTVSFECPGCRAYKSGTFASDDLRDVVYCDCGCVYLVTRPYVTEVRALLKHAEGD